MVGFQRGARKPRLAMLVARALLVSLLTMILAFAISLLLAIGGLMIKAHNGGTVDMTFAYRHIAAPVALVVGPIVLVLSLAMEFRHYRQAKALASIERAG